MDNLSYLQTHWNYESSQDKFVMKTHFVVIFLKNFPLSHSFPSILVIEAKMFLMAKNRNETTKNKPQDHNDSKYNDKESQYANIIRKYFGYD